MYYIFVSIYFILFFFPHSIRSQELVSNENNKTVLVTGAAGFIGSNFLQYMFDKYPHYHFIVIDALTYAGSLEKIPEYIQKSPRFEFIHDTITHEKTVDSVMARSNLVVHFAAETHVTRSIRDDGVFFTTDVLGTRALMSAVVKYTKHSCSF